MINFGDLRSILKSPPSPQGWARIVELLDQASADEVRELIPYLRAHLEPWPEAWRAAPAEWIARVASGEEVPQLKLISALDASTLRILSIRGNGLRAQDLADWLEVLELRQLHTLDLSDNDLRDDAIMCLVEHPIASTLRELTIQRHALSLRGFEFLASSPTLSGLERLDLGDSELTQEQASTLAQARQLPALRSLSLASTTFEDEAFDALFERGELMGQLRALDLRQLRCSSWRRPVELASRPLQALESLDLSGLRFDQNHSYNGRPFLRLVGESLPSLKRLSLANIQGFPDPLVLAINSSSRHRLSWGHFPALESLNLQQNALSYRSLRHLSKSFEQLQELRIDLSLIGPMGAQLLAESINLPDHITNHWAMVSQGFRGSHR